MTMTLQHYLNKIQKERNLTHSTIKIFKSALTQYEQINNMTLQELLEEAEQEEEQGIRWKNRQLPQRLLQYQNHLLQKYNQTTAETYMTKVKTFYKHHLIEIHTRSVKGSIYLGETSDESIPAISHQYWLC